MALEYKEAQDIPVMIRMDTEMQHVEILSESRFLDLLFYEDDDNYPPWRQLLPPRLKPDIRGYVSFFNSMQELDELVTIYKRFVEDYCGLTPSKGGQFLYSFVPASLFSAAQLTAARAFVNEVPVIPPSKLSTRLVGWSTKLTSVKPWIL